MNKLLDKLVLFTLCIAVYLMHERGIYLVIPVLLAILAASVSAYLKNDIKKLALFSAYIGACVFLPQLLYFLPELCYELPKKRWWWLLLTAVPLFCAFLGGSSYIVIFSLLLTAVGYLMSYRTAAIEQTRLEYIQLRDSAKELSLKLEYKNRALMQSQDYEVNLATLRERNRIARDIHDGVGHLLSSAILQVGAIMATGKDPAEKERLETVKGTLKEAMDSIRASVHNLYDESIDLYTVLRGVVAGYTFCPVTLDYHVTQSPDKNLQYAFIAIIKEALSNTAKHSGATAAAITLHEQPGFYSLIVSDNGRGFSGKTEPDGIGLKSISERVEGAGGILTINGQKGFKLFISVPKDGVDK
jgi:signal transduction histidine kinase